MKYFFLATALSFGIVGSAQDRQLPYYEIPDYPESFSAGAVAARLMDGLGFRFYWATEGMREVDLQFRPSPEARSTEETVEHIYGMSITIRNATTNTMNVPGQNRTLSFAEMRKATLENFHVTSSTLRTSSESDMNHYRMVFKSGNDTSEFPFWNVINGPISDCLWHVGQVITFRRSSGNPYNSKAGVLTGKVQK